ncbi:MAG: MBOAT family protein [Holophagales bacterium]|nr:MAG: MBOAT family protein [Holophagales bacterium]
MVFSSHLFVFGFLPLALAVYYLLPRRGRHLALTLLSYLFYGWTSPAFCLLLLVSTLIDYVCGLLIAGDVPFAGGGEPPMLDRATPRTRAQKTALLASIVSNLSLLAFFKYFDFAVENWNALASATGVPEAALARTLEVTLPLGISFYTFQSMSYTLDVYRGEARALRSAIDFACYVSMFPQLVAGPIIRFAEVADQMRSRTHTVAKFSRGVAFLAVGLGKKVLLANPCGKVADTVFGAASASAVEAWSGLVAYAFQIYFDFSGYSDMAIGLGLMLGFVFARNFDSPYRAESITDFWRRWHISLSTWLRDYLYVPLGGNRKGERRTYVNLALVMLLGGLWHGASWNFVLWGGWHGLWLAAERAAGKRSLLPGLPRTGRIAATFLVVLLSWVPFRAVDLASAGRYFSWLVGFGEAPGGAGLLAGVVFQPYYLAVLAISALIIWRAPQAWSFTRTLTWPRAAACAGLLVAALTALAAQEFNPFIYFIF